MDPSSVPASLASLPPHEGEERRKGSSSLSFAVSLARSHREWQVRVDQEESLRISPCFHLTLFSRGFVLLSSCKPPTAEPGSQHTATLCLGEGSP